MGDENDVKLHPEAVQFRVDLQKVLDSFREITFCAVTEKFAKWLETKGHQIKFVTVYKYLTETTPPAWLFPYVCEFLTQEPYLNYINVWEFIRKWGGPIEGSLGKISEKAFEKKQNLSEQAKRYDEFL